MTKSCPHGDDTPNSLATPKRQLRLIKTLLLVKNKVKSD